jgi:hypothetical protein
LETLKNQRAKALKLSWIRGNDKINFSKPNVYFCLGVRGSGKSSLLEHIGEAYLAEGNSIFDLFSSRDGENLAWLRSEHAKDKKILLLKGENVDVKSSFPVKVADKVTLQDFENNDIVISTSPFYLNADQEFTYAASLTDLLYKRMYHKHLIYLIAREAANFYYSRLKVSDNQIYAKSQMVYLIREARHMGLALGLDSIRYYAIDIDIRSLADYLLLKSQGVQGLTKDLKWLYSYVHAGLIRNMSPERFILVSHSGALGYGVFPFPTWHKVEKENILNSVGVKVEYGEVLEQGQNKGLWNTVGDKEHAEIITLYVEGMGMQNVAKEKGRSTRTIQVHVVNHNVAVNRAGFCAACKRVGSTHFNQPAIRKKVEKSMTLPSESMVKTA